MGVSRRTVCGVGLMSKSEFLAEAIEILEDYKDGENIQRRAHEFLKKYYASLEVKRIDSRITERFEKAKVLVAQGKMIKTACAETGLTREQWNRRMRIQKQGRDRDYVRE